MMHKGVISCEENVNELESVDAALRRHTCDVEKLQMAHKRLVELESGIEGLENRLEYFRESDNRKGLETAEQISQT
ncbi:hypothetical protein Gohar_013218 [Gossypium harknessii]|uniref:Uncharacterized protein n=1 Tax=Gossypium harknessii TaxID=34285 RepID=A0A7J9H0U8_9ROSI|nr:hypothetical protein [Gossypium harknessii]